MRFILTVLLIVVVTACTSETEQTSSDSADTIVSAVTTPQIINPNTQTEFVASDIVLRWEAMDLADTQRYVLRLWYADEAPQEVWTVENEVPAQSMIDTYSRDVGTYYWQVAVVNTNAEGGFDSMATDWSAEQELYRVRRLSLTALAPEEMSATARYIYDQNLQSVSEIADFTQEWMYNNTNIGAELSGYLPDYSDAADMMFAHFQNEAEAPQMYCNGISTTMLTVLRELGIESRIVYLYGQANGWIAEHTILEVFNSDLQEWHVYDPTVNLHFVDTETGQRASIERMIFGNTDTIAGCFGNDCNPELYQDTLIERMGVFRYGFVTEIWVNPDRFDIAQRIPAFDNANLPEFIAMNSGTTSSNLTFRFDSWEN